MRLSCRLVLEEIQGLSYADIMMRLLMTRTHIKIDNLMNTFAHMALIYQEIDRYNLGVLEVSTKCVFQCVNGEILMKNVAGLIDSFTDFDDLASNSKSLM